jgi:hypothetical protein
MRDARATVLLSRCDICARVNLKSATAQAAKYLRLDLFVLAVTILQRIDGDPPSVM